MHACHLGRGPLACVLPGAGAIFQNDHPTAPHARPTHLTRQISHIISNGHFSSTSENVAIPTVLIQGLKHPQGNYVRIFRRPETPRPHGATPPLPIGGNCTTQASDTPATRRKRASCSAKPPTLTPAVTPTPEPMPSVTHSFGHADPVDTLDAELVHSHAYAIRAFDSRTVDACSSGSHTEAAGSNKCRHR